MIGGMPDETADEKLAREEWEALLDSGVAVTVGGMVMQVLPDGLYIDGVKAEAGEPPSKAQMQRELEARRVPTRARETDFQRRGKVGETRGLQVPTTPIRTGAGARTVKTEPEEKAPDEPAGEGLVYPCPLCDHRGRTPHARRIHFARKHPGRSVPFAWPDPVPAHSKPPETPREDLMEQPAVTPIPAGAELPGGKGTVLSRGVLIEPDAEEEAAPARPFEPAAPSPEEPQANGSSPADLRAQALKDIAGEPPWTPLWARTDAILKAQGVCAEALIPLTTRDRAIVLSWLTLILQSDGEGSE